MTYATASHITSPKLDKRQRHVRSLLDSVGLSGLDLHVGATPILDLPADDLDWLAQRLSHPLAAVTTPPPARAALFERTRHACERRGAVWVRANVRDRFGRRMLRDLTNVELKIVLTDAALAAG